MSVFSNRLVSLRKEKGITQSGLGKVINKTRSTVSGYESEGKEPDYNTLSTMAEYFGVSTDYLLGISDCRTNSEAVFINDTRNFKKHFDSLPPSTRQQVAKMYDAFYVLLSRDMENLNDERISLYGELFNVLQSRRAEVRNKINFSNGQLDASLMSEIMNLQSSFKNEINQILDNLLQADIDTVFNVKKDTELSG